MKFLGRLFVCLLLIGLGYFLCKNNVFEIVARMIKDFIDNLNLSALNF